jgi:hypothetical protein
VPERLVTLGPVVSDAGAVRASTPGEFALNPPTPAQALLLQALTSPAEQGTEAWRRWAGAVDVDHLEPDSQWLLPLLFERLRAADVSAPIVGRYGNVFRHNWYKAHVRFLALRLVLDELRRLGHETIVLGGTALAAAYYPVLGTRPFDSLTLAVAPELTIDEIRSVERRIPAAVGAVVRWLPLRRSTATHEVSVAGLVLAVPDAADLLIQVFADAATGDDRSNLQWAVDAVVVGRTLDPNGWDTAWRIAAADGVTATVEARLEWLRTAGLSIDRRDAL